LPDPLPAGMPKAYHCAQLQPIQRNLPRLNASFIAAMGSVDNGHIHRGKAKPP